MHTSYVDRDPHVVWQTQAHGNRRWPGEPRHPFGGGADGYTERIDMAAYSSGHFQNGYGIRRLPNPFERAVNALIVGTSVATFGTVVTFLSYFILSCYGVC